MKKKNKIVIICDYLNKLFADADCELNYVKDYELLIAVMLSAQTTDKMVNKVTDHLFNKYKNLEDLNAANTTDIIEIIKPIGMSLKKADYIKSVANEILVKYSGIVPNDRIKLEGLKGVGRKTTNLVLAILYGEPFIAVDTHVSRVSKRLGLANDKDDVVTVENKLYKVFQSDQILKIHYQMVLFGRYHCKAIKPKCEICDLKSICRYFAKKGKFFQ